MGVLLKGQHTRKRWELQAWIVVAAEVRPRSGAKARRARMLLLVYFMVG